MEGGSGSGDDEEPDPNDPAYRAARDQRQAETFSRHFGK